MTDAEHVTRETLAYYRRIAGRLECIRDEMAELAPDYDTRRSVSYGGTSCVSSGSGSVVERRVLENLERRERRGVLAAEARRLMADRDVIESALEALSECQRDFILARYGGRTWRHPWTDHGRLRTLHDSAVEDFSRVF